MGGLSPLTRGTRLNQCVLLRHCRFIPAHAGNTIVSSRSGVDGSVYPRSRGEHGDMLANSESATGLSPLTRGTPRGDEEAMHKYRFIPAHAGNTISFPATMIILPVYPRSRGEHLLGLLMLQVQYGLSPLTRGTPICLCILVFKLRFIPAHAGNT